jgi:hypothetical protein
LLHDGADYFGFNRPIVMDVAGRGDSIVVLHVAQSTTRLTVIQPRFEVPSGWRTLQSIAIPLQIPVGSDYATVGLAGRIVQLDDIEYLCFSRTDAPHDVFRVNGDDVVIEADPTVVRAVTKAANEDLKAESEAKDAEMPASQPE